MKQFKINDELISKIKKLIEDNNTHKLLSSLADIHYADLAEIFELLETTEVIFLVKIFDKQKIADALAEIDEDLREVILEKLSAKEIAEKRILNELKRNKIELICLAGFMKILSNNFIKSYKGKILNIHPSLLPKYKGLNTHQRAIENKDKYSGCTVHFVDSKLDSGKIIIQKKVNILKKDTPDRLAKRILAQEHKLYPKAIMRLFSL